MTAGVGLRTGLTELDAAKYISRFQRLMRGLTLFHAW